MTCNSYYTFDKLEELGYTEIKFKGLCVHLDFNFQRSKNLSIMDII